MIYMFLSNNPSSGDINSSNLPCCVQYWQLGCSAAVLQLLQLNIIIGTHHKKI